MISEWDISEKALGGAGALGAAVFMLQKMITFWRREDTAQASTAAATEQFKSLQDSIKANREELIELRASFNIMDKKIHVQQRTITRMEMLLRLFSGLVQEKGIDVPTHMKAELEDLIEADADISKFKL
jgi:hypothetical protein